MLCDLTGFVFHFPPATDVSDNPQHGCGLSHSNSPGFVFYFPPATDLSDDPQHGCGLSHSNSTSRGRLQAHCLQCADSVLMCRLSFTDTELQNTLLAVCR
jgi:hypothetical protein